MDHQEPRAGLGESPLWGLCPWLLPPTLRTYQPPTHSTHTPGRSYPPYHHLYPESNPLYHRFKRLSSIFQFLFLTIVSFVCSCIKCLRCWELWHLSCTLHFTNECRHLLHLKKLISVSSYLCRQQWSGHCRSYRKSLKCRSFLGEVAGCDWHPGYSKEIGPAPKSSLGVSQVVGTQEFRRSGRSKTEFLEELGFVESFEDK